jgi:hypothetical protein
MNGPVRLQHAPRPWRTTYLCVLLWSFTVFNVLRLLTYAPTLWALHESGRSDQHSLFTWVGWTLSNLTMALWLYEKSQHRLDGAVAVNFGNAAMCAIASLLIIWYRL